MLCVRLASAQVATNDSAANPFQVVDSAGHVLPLFSVEAYRAEFRHLSNEFRKINLLGPPVATDGWTTNIPEAEWPVMTAAYLGYACANLAGIDPARRNDYFAEMRWLLDALQTPRLSGFVKPHFGEPFAGKEIHAAVFLHGHFLNLATRYREVSGDTEYDALIHRVAAALTADYLGTTQGILRSYRDMWWITDNFPALAALARYDRLFHHNTSVARAKFLQSLKEYYLDKRTGLFATYIIPEGHVQSQGPRGISVMYGLHFLKDFDPVFAENQYSRAQQFLINGLFGVGAVREFPPGGSGKGDVDSGPVIFGMGASASGFGIAAAVINGDPYTAKNLLNSTALVGLPELRDGELHYAAMPMVGQAVILFGKTEILKYEHFQVTNSPLENLLTGLEVYHVKPGRDAAGNINSLAIGRMQLDDRNLAVISQIESLKTLRVTTPSKFFPPGVAAVISTMTNLTTFGLACSFNLQAGVVPEIAKMRGLQSLTLYYSRPPANEYASLTNLCNLTELRLWDCTNFTDVDLHLLTNFTKLTNLEVHYSPISAAATNVLSRLTNLTHLTIQSR